MKIILLKDIQKIGKKYDIKDVADGFGLNMLIPRGLAQVATPAALKNIETLKSKDLAERRVQGELLLKSLSLIKDLTLKLKEKANDKGHLFASVTKEILAQEILKTARLNINPDSIKLEKPIKETGEYKVSVEAVGKSAEFNVIIEAK